MGGEWHETTLGAIATKDGYGLVDGPFGSDLPASLYTEIGVPVIRGSNLTLGTGRFRSEEFVFVSSDTAKRLERSLCKPLDIIFTKKGTLGQAGLVPEGGKYCRYLLSSNQMKLTVDNAVADPLFVYYVVSSPDCTQKIIRDSEATGVPKTNVTYLREFPIVLPPLPEQRAIAHILGTLDDKIELNRKMSETLEAMARALFKSWFVDFDPVRAKMEGRDPGLPKEIADLFPSRMVESELGEIPEGWEMGSVESICESITSGGTPARMNPLYWEGGSIPWFKTGELLDGPLIESEEHITRAALVGSSCKLWPAGTILFALYASPTVGRLGVLTRSGTSNQAAAGLIAKAEFGVPFLRRLLLNARLKLQTIAVGAAQQNINQAVLKSHRTVMPTHRTASAYSRLVAAADDRQVALAKEISALASLRDALLPKLISGEIRIPAAVRHFEEAIA